ncbi:DNA-processing protein DprA [Patescibacteria group bacterium]|nr:DNA-processing protein DprA [Patescibacteria group bacterium]
MDTNELKYWIAFSQIPQVGAKRFKLLILYFENLNEAWEASSFQYIKSGLDKKTVEQIINSKQNIDPDFEMDLIQKHNVQVVTIKDKDYPKQLAQIYNPPALFYYKGNLKILDQPCLSVVGTRKITSYGKRVTAEIVAELTKSDLTIVSGLAFGVDALAHQTTIDNDGKTAAVLGSGLDSIYPINNTRLAYQIIEKGGCLISEYPIGMGALKHHFPVRNRIISGLSLGTLVTEAGFSSGALITTKFALDQNRQIFAVPGSIYNDSATGPNKLIKFGATPVLCADDILEALNIEKRHQHQKVKKIIPDSPQEKMIIDILSSEPITIDKIVKLTAMDIQKVNSTLTMMEMKGMVKNLGGGNYVLCS